MTLFEDLESAIADVRNKTDYLGYGSDFLRFGKDVSDPATTALVICLVDGSYNGESFTAGDILFGDNSAGEENIVYKNKLLRVRNGNTIVLTFGEFGMRIANGGLAIQQVDITVGSGNMELDENGDFISSSYLYISASTGPFTLDSIAVPHVPGHYLIIANRTNNAMSLTNEYATPTFGYHSIHTYTAGTVSTTADGLAVLIDNPVNGAWDLISLTG